jgi:hypothetical protein
MSKPVVEHFVSFNSQEVIVRTDDPRVSQFVRETYEHMLTDSTCEVVGEVTVLSDHGTFEIRRSNKAGLSAEEPSALFPQIVDDVLDEFMEARPDLLWLHAGVAQRDGMAVLIPARSGGGKSTITTAFVEHGWQFMSDDIAPIMIGELRVLSYPQRPTRRKFPGNHVADGRIGGLERESVSLAPDDVHLGHADLKTIIFPEFGARATPRLTRLTPGEGAMKLIGSVRNFLDHREAAIEAIADVARAAELYQFDYGDPLHAYVLIEHKKDFGFFLAK